jgi:hypothetical protein
LDDPDVARWQLSVPATGLTHSDHFHPGSKVNRPAVVPHPHDIDACLLGCPAFVRRTEVA